MTDPADQRGARPEAPGRGAYPVFRPIQTRWSDNDVYGHVNNVVFYSWFDTAVNGHLVDAGLLDPVDGEVIGLVVNTECCYYSSASFPELLEAGISVARVGRSSVEYRVGIFRAGGDRAIAAGRFVHVYVDRGTRRPVPLPDAMRAGLAGLEPG